KGARVGGEGEGGVRRRRRRRRRHREAAHRAARGARRRPRLRHGACARADPRPREGRDRPRAARPARAARVGADGVRRGRASPRPRARRSTDDPDRIVKLQGFHGRAGFGRRPALIVVDMSVGFTSDESPLHCDLEPVVEAIERLLAATRAARLPVVYTTVAYDDAGKETAAVFIDKVPALLTLEAGSRWVEIDPRLAPEPGEPVITKLHASAFFRTPLASLLAAQQVDGVIVTGASTSGCVRATA